MTKLSLTSLIACVVIIILALLISNGYGNSVGVAAVALLFVYLCAWSALGFGRTLRWVSGTDGIARTSADNIRTNVARDFLIGLPLFITLFVCSEVFPDVGTVFFAGVVVAAFVGFVAWVIDYVEICMRFEWDGA